MELVDCLEVRSGQLSGRLNGWCFVSRMFSQNLERGVWLLKIYYVVRLEMLSKIRDLK